jgi:hypothetical protein
MRIELLRRPRSLCNRNIAGPGSVWSRRLKYDPGDPFFQIDVHIDLNSTSRRVRIAERDLAKLSPPAVSQSA